MSVYVIGSRKDNCPPFDELEIKGYFSFDSGRRLYLNDSSQLRYFYPPSTSGENHFDLNKGIDSALPKVISSTDDHLDTVLRWIQSNKHSIQASADSGRWLQPNFIFWRGVMSILLKTPYNGEQAGWILYAAKFKGTIYMVIIDTEKLKSQESNLNQSHMQLEFWRKKIDQYVLSDDPNQPPDTSEPLDPNKQFCGVFQSRLGDHRLLYAAQIRGVQSAKALTDPLPLDDSKIIETKINRVIEAPRQLINFKKNKTINWWSQCVLTGVDNILCSFRDNEGIVCNFKNYSVSDLVKISQAFWNPSVAMNFVNGFLEYVSKTVVDDWDKTLYKFEKPKNSNIRMTEVLPSECAFLPAWYTESTD